MNTPTRIQKESFSLTEGKGPSFNMITIPGGSYHSQDKVNIKLPSFQLGQHLVSQELWEAITGENPSHFIGPGRPVETISWYDAVEFCNQLSGKLNLEPAYTIDKSRKDENSLSEYDSVKWLVRLRKDANGFRLPFEAEWAYAASGGPYSRQSAYAGSQDLNQVGWYDVAFFDKNSHGQTHVHGLKAPNELGLYDMSGNLREWCWDWHAYDLPHISEMNNPIYGPERGLSRVLRGGSWFNYADRCRVSLRSDGLPDNRNDRCGLRLARTLSF